MTVDGILKRRCGAWSTVERIRRQLARKGMGEWKKLLKRLFVGVIKKESKKKGVWRRRALPRGDGKERRKIRFYGWDKLRWDWTTRQRFSFFRYNAVVDGLSCG